MDLSQLRGSIDEIDDQMVALFRQRMALSAQIGAYKQANGLPVLVPGREREKLADLAEKAGPELANDIRSLYATVFELSRNYQRRRDWDGSPLYRRITQAMEQTPKLFPQRPTVACQGVEGAFSQIACGKIFQDPFPLYFKSFDGVFQAIEQGLCQYGVLPIENSSAGSVNKVYDLMIRHDFSIIRSFRMKVDHCLLAKPGVELSEIREIYSHEQAIHQCAGFLNRLSNVKITPLENTALAAQAVSTSERRDVAALASRACAELYGLRVVAPSVQDSGNNHTRFLCISRNLEIYPGANKTSIMMILPHRPGSLYRVLSRLYVLGINVTKLESRPLPDREFEFMFYLDLETSVYSAEFAQLMCDLTELCEEFKYLGSYTEVV